MDVQIFLHDIENPFDLSPAVLSHAAQKKIFQIIKYENGTMYRRNECSSFFIRYFIEVPRFSRSCKNSVIQFLEYAVSIVTYTKFQRALGLNFEAFISSLFFIARRTTQVRKNTIFMLEKRTPTVVNMFALKCPRLVKRHNFA